MLELLQHAKMEHSKPIFSAILSQFALSAYVSDPFDNPTYYLSIVEAL